MGRNTPDVCRECGASPLHRLKPKLCKKCASRYDRAANKRRKGLAETPDFWQPKLLPEWEVLKENATCQYCGMPGLVWRVQRWRLKGRQMSVNGFKLYTWNGWPHRCSREFLIDFHAGEDLC